MQALKKEVDELHQHGVSLRFTGCRQALSASLQNEMRQAEELTAVNNQLILNIVINYGGRWEIVDAVKTISAKVQAGELALNAIDDALFASYLNTDGLPDPDLFIRTSGEQRISNFFLWQLAYTELYFSSVHWPDFNEAEFEQALANFKQRERRFGKLSQQLDDNTHV